MSQKAPTIIDLVRVKSWYIPGSTFAYQTLVKLNVPLLKIHRDFLPTLKLATDRANVRARSRLFSDILNERLDLVGSKWKAVKGRTCKLNDTRLVFSAPLSEHNKAVTRKLDVSLNKFFARWGFSYLATYSTSGERMKLVVDYKFDPNRNPVITSVVPEEKREFEMVFGFTKLKFTFWDKPKASTDSGVAINVRRHQPPMIQTEVFVLGGSEWRQLHTSTCVQSQIGDPSQFMSAMSLMFDKFVTNE